MWNVQLAAATLTAIPVLIVFVSRNASSSRASPTPGSRDKTRLRPPPAWTCFWPRGENGQVNFHAAAFIATSLDGYIARPEVPSTGSPRGVVGR